ncbi:MAG: 5'-methylthioadenosine/S-adenosylhomocysteine nucleosidase [Synergistaceae bacterium]|nr:5'-methylthioadenosine/S-adenosylhomocysteine nucleosidase [Synergistaceae bacterium]
MKIGIIGAMDSEVSLLREAMNITRETVKAGMIFTEGKLGGNEAVIAKCGMGKVNAGVCTQILIDTFGATHIINTGVAGALNDSLNIGDIVVSVDAVQDDFDVTHIGFRAGEIPYTGKIAFEADGALRAEAVGLFTLSHRG